MNFIRITLTDERLAELQEFAARLNVTPEDLARAGVEGLLEGPEESCQHVIRYVLEKNAELYRRLA